MKDEPEWAASLHALIRTGIDDLKTSLDQGVKQNMNYWQLTNSEGKICSVCLAGATMLQKGVKLIPDDDLPSWARTLNCLRMGSLDLTDVCNCMPLELDRSIIAEWDEAGHNVCIISDEMEVDEILEELEARYEFLKQRNI